MSTASSSANLSEPSRPRRPVFPLQIPSPSLSDQSASGDDFNHTHAPRPRIARHYTTLQEHADAVNEEHTTPGGGFFTPGVDDRREGFSWEAHRSEQMPSSPSLRPLPIPSTPPSMDEILHHSSQNGRRDREPPSADNAPPWPPSNRMSVASSAVGTTISRSDTNRSSISSIAKGVMRHIPDMRMFLPLDKKLEGVDHSNNNSSRRKSKTERQPKSDALQKSADREVEERLPTLPKAPIEKPLSPSKATLKDRRKLAQSEAMKLTLPLDLPQLPSRGRSPIAEHSSVTRSRPRSPKTPWMHDHSPSQYTSGLATAPATILEDDTSTPGRLPRTEPVTQTLPANKSNAGVRNRHSIVRLRFGRSRTASRTSDSPLQSSDTFNTDAQQLSEPHLEPKPHAQEELKELGKRSRSRRLRWNGSWASNSDDLNETPSPSRSAFSLTRFIKPKRSAQDESHEQSLRYHEQPHSTLSIADMQAIASMPVPPAFVPPGVTRVPTPPMHDTNGEVKGKLADFFFDIQGVRRNKRPTTPDGIWDSDAILMSQITDISPPSSTSDESPQGLSLASLNDISPSYTVNALTPNAQYFNVPATPISPTPTHIDALESDTLSRARRSDTPNDLIARAAEERAKLEWLLPEHYPNSPLCPLHANYKGPSKGFCVHHGRRISSGSSVPGGRRGTKRESVASRYDAAGVLDGFEEGRGRKRRTWFAGFKGS